MNILESDIKDFIFPLIIYDNEFDYHNSLKLNYLNDSKVILKDIEKHLDSLLDFGIENILLFGVPKKRDEIGRESYNIDGIIQKTVRRIKSNFGNDVNVISDVCVCQYNTTGHCGLINQKMKNNISGLSNLQFDNDKTLEILGKIALSLCESGTDFISPSSMMDGQVLYLKKLLMKNGFNHVKILSYSAKHNSSLYFPFRNNNYLNSLYLDKSSYQCSFHNQRESAREILYDVEEGSDWVMVKPCMWYMDLVKRMSEEISIPLVVQNVSGEYVLIKNLAKNKYFNEMDYLSSLFGSLKRSGADKIISYFVLDLLKHAKAI